VINYDGYEKRKRLPKGCRVFVLKFDCEIPRGFGEIKVYTFGIGYFNGEVENFGALPVGYSVVALVALIILLKTRSKSVKK